MPKTIQTNYNGIDIVFGSERGKQLFECLSSKEKDTYVENVKHRKQLDCVKNEIISVIVKSELSIADIGLVLSELTNKHQSNIDKFLNITPASHCYQDI